MCIDSKSIMRPTYFKTFSPWIVVYVHINFGGIKEWAISPKQFSNYQLYILQFSFLNFKVFYGASTSIVLRLPKILRTFFGSFTRIFWMLKLALYTETLKTLQELVFIYLCEYQWDSFWAAALIVFLTNEGSNLRWNPLVPVTKRLHEILPFIESL